MSAGSPLQGDFSTTLEMTGRDWGILSAYSTRRMTVGAVLAEQVGTSIRQFSVLEEPDRLRNTLLEKTPYVQSEATAGAGSKATGVPLDDGTGSYFSCLPSILLYPNISKSVEYLF